MQDNEKSSVNEEEIEDVTDNTETVCEIEMAPTPPAERKITVKRCFLITVAVAVTVFLFSGVYFSKVYREKYNANVVEGNETFTAEEMARFKEIYALLKENYIGDIDDDKMALGAFRGYVAGVEDVYTAYMTADEFNGFIDGDYGNKVGVGIRVYMNKESEGMNVYAVFADTPADKAGIEIGDVIVKVDDFEVTYENYSEAVDRVAGEVGSTVKLTVKRGAEQLTIPIVRDNFTVSSVEYRMIEGDIGYVRIDGIASDTAKAFKEAVETLKKQGAKKYVFDVREDGGGYLDSIVAILDMLLPEGPIVRWELADGTTKQESSDKERIVDAPFAVLINKQTASAAELFAAALKDYKLATLVGNTTYGKGVMQTLYRLSNGDCVKITTSKYLPPYSENYNGVGVKPDIEVSLPEGKTYFMLSEAEDVQLQAAIKALNEIKTQG